jgi:hypothetical protein
MAVASAFIGNSKVGHEFRFNPDTVNWGFKENVAIKETIGGRVIQVLSVQVQQMIFQGMAGTRRELQRLALNIDKIMTYNINYRRPVRLTIPSRKWDFLVYPQGLPRIGWDITTVPHPFELTLAVEEDFGIVTDQILQHEIDRLAKDIGYDSKWHGGDAAAWLNLASTLSGLGQGAPLDASGNPLGGPTTDVPKNVAAIQDQLVAGLKSVGGSRAAAMAAAVKTNDFYTWVNTESGWNPQNVSPANNQGVNNGGLFQFWYGHPWAQRFFSQGGGSSYAQGNRFLMSVPDQARSLMQYFDVDVNKVHTYASQINSGTYKGWG